VSKTTFRIFHWMCRLFVGAIFCYAGYTKVENPLQFAAAIEAYRLLPPSMVILVADWLPWIEIVLGLLVLAGLRIRLTSGTAAGILGFFIIIMLVTYLRGIEADCGCFGVGERISPLTLLRDTLMMLPALFLLLQPRLESRLLRAA